MFIIVLHMFCQSPWDIRDKNALPVCLLRKTDESRKKYFKKGCIFFFWCSPPSVAEPSQTTAEGGTGHRAQPHPNLPIGTKPHAAY